VAVAGRFVCLLGARDEGFGDLVLVADTVGFIGLAGREENDDSFSPVVDLMGDLGNACELLDLGESTVVGAGLRDAVFEAAVDVAVAVFVRFLGLGISPWAYVFSLSSAPKCSLVGISKVKWVMVECAFTLFSSGSSSPTTAQRLSVGYQQLA